MTVFAQVGLASQAEADLQAFEDLVRGWPEVSTSLVTIGDNSQKTPNLASIFVRLLPPDKRKALSARLKRADLRR